MGWEKRGRIHVPSGNRWWNVSHAQLPVAIPIDGDRLRIYFGTRDDRNRTRTTYVEVEAENPASIVYEHDEVVLDLGPIGAFDDRGAMPSWLVTTGGRTYLFYIGWTVRDSVPYHNAIGLAASDDGGRTFTRVADGPVIGTTHDEPYFCGTSCVLVEDGRWRNWYLSCTGWTEVDGRPEPRYHIKYAESDDGVRWRRERRVAIDYASDDEGGIVKASVVRDGDLYRMWYSHRMVSGYRDDVARSYRIGYAESPDGLTWTRRDHLAGISVSPSGWDCAMIAYPHVVDHAGRRLLFYNGNGFGRSGFGYAVWVDAGTESGSGSAPR